MGVEDIEFLGFLLYLWKFQTKESFTPTNSTKLLHILEILRHKTKAPGNSIFFFDQAWKF